MNYKKVCDYYFDLKTHCKERQNHIEKKRLKGYKAEIIKQQNIREDKGDEWFYFEYCETYDFGKDKLEILDMLMDNK